MKKTVFAFTTAAIAASVAVIPAVTSLAADDVKIDETNFPDEQFRTYVSEEFDLDGDDLLTEAEIAKVTEIKIENMTDPVKDIKGVEYFTELEVLDLLFQKVETADLTQNTKLKELWIRNNELTELDLTNNKDLQILSCSENKSLASLKIAGLANLEEVDASGCSLTSIDLLGCTALTKLEVNQNQLSKLYVGDSKNLVKLECTDNKIAKLDLSENKELTNLAVSYNQLTDLDISNNPELVYLGCAHNLLVGLDLSENHKLTYLYCQGNKIEELDISPAQNLVKAKDEGNYEYDDDDNPTYVTYDYLPSDFDDTGKGDCSLCVDTDVKITSDSINIVADKNIVECGKTLKLKVNKNGRPAEDPVEWTVSDKSAASIDSKNVLKAKKAGNVTITAKINGMMDELTIFVLYKDVTNEKDFWYKPTNELTKMNVVKGYDKMTLFKPANNCTRAQMVTFIWRLQGEPEPETDTCKFTDVKEKDYFYKACIWGNEKGIVEGYKDGTFGPQIVCARKHAVTFLWRLAGKPDPSSATCKFTDVKEKDYFYKPVIWASECGIVAGYKDNTFKPNGDCLRRQMVTFLYKFHKVQTDSESIDNER